MENREGFKSRLGFILVSAGCAIGIGNVWKFPYVAGQNGGAIFVLFYLLFLVIMGIPVMTMEFAVGRASGMTAVNGYRALEKKGSKWHIHGWICHLGCLMLMMYYTTVAGWMVAYAVKFATGAFDGIASEDVSAIFGEMLADPGQMLFYMALVVILGFAVLLFGVQGGLERANKVMMLGLLALIIILAVHSMLLPGAGEGIAFYLLPNATAAAEIGWINVIVAAMNQAFFTLSLGVGALEIFGSYMDRSHTLGGEAIRIGLLDTFVALMAGLIIFPACFSFQVAPDQGPSLIFVTLPQVFIHMNGGRIWGTLFFVFMTFASFSTVTAVFENLVAGFTDNFKITRKKAILLNFFIVLILSIPCALGYNVLSGVHIIGARDILDSEDFIVSNILLPLGSLIFLLFCVTKYGWGFDNYLKEVNTGVGFQMPGWIKNYLRFVLPLLILFIFISGIL